MLAGHDWKICKSTVIMVTPYFSHHVHLEDTQRGKSSIWFQCFLLVCFKNCSLNHLRLWINNTKQRIEWFSSTIYANRVVTGGQIWVRNVFFCSIYSNQTWNVYMKNPNAFQSDLLQCHPVFFTHFFNCNERGNKE